MRYRVGLLSISDGRGRVHQNLLTTIQEHNARLVAALEASGQVEVIQASAPLTSPETARLEATRLLQAGVSGTIIHQPVFGFPHYAVIAAQILPSPFLILAPKHPDLPSFNGLMTIASAFARLGIPHARLWGNIDDPSVFQQVMAFIRAASAVRRLRGQVFGLLGGRSMGLSGSVPAVDLWVRKFGVDVDHADEYEIVRRADGIAADRVAEGKRWLTGNFGSIDYDGLQLTSSKLELQIRSYLATKRIVADYGWDFLGVKCHYEMSEYFVTQCLTASLLNDPYDWEGPKEPTVVSCEADGDGALTMQLLKLLTGGSVSLNDIRYFDQEAGLWVLINCGASPTWFAAQSANPSENLAKVRLAPVVSKYAGGGAHVCFQYKGGPVTLSRLQRLGDSYQLVLLKGQIEERPIDRVRGAVNYWPIAFVRLDLPEDALIQILNANHIHMVVGDLTKELELAAEFLGIDVIKPGTN